MARQTTVIVCFSVVDLRRDHTLKLSRRKVSSAQKGFFGFFLDITVCILLITMIKAFNDIYTVAKPSVFVFFKCEMRKKLETKFLQKNLTEAMAAFISHFMQIKTREEIRL